MKPYHVTKHGKNIMRNKNYRPIFFVNIKNNTKIIKTKIQKNSQQILDN